MATTAANVQHAANGEALFARIGAFLALHRLSPDPEHYAFAYHVVVHGDSDLAREVEAITEGGVRLTGSDIASMGTVVRPGEPLGGAGPTDAPAAVDDGGASDADMLVARAVAQLHGVADTIRLVHAEAGDFGRDLRASADAITASGTGVSVAEITRLTTAMIDRVGRAEHRLTAAQREADGLREELDSARGSALTDPLTELPNRRAFDAALAAVTAEAPRVVAMCDIDHFKRVNDGFGHLVGDRILKVVAQVLADELGGMVARWGGEEFAILFAHGDVDAAVAALDRTRAALASRRLRVRETGEAVGTVSFSAGVATVHGADAGTAALDRADRALYRAKDAGRARTVRAD